jgi:hypothetical protein
VLLAALVACGTTLAIAPDPGPPSDGGADGDADAAPDAEARIEAGDGFCKGMIPVPTACADFDEGDPSLVFVDGVAKAWKADGTKGSGARSLDPSVRQSPPASLRVAIPATDGGQARQILSLPLSSARGHVNIAFDLYVDDVVVDQVHVITLGGLEMGTGVEPYKLNLAVASSDAGDLPLFVTEVNHPDGGGYAFAPFETTGTVKRKTWTRLTLDVVLDASGFGSVTVSVGRDDSGITVLKRPIEHGALGAPTLTLDLFTDSSGITVYYDDYVAVTEP